MEILEARYSDGELHLKMRGAECWTWLKSFKPGEWDITRAYKKRSLSANAYAWTLIGQIAKTVHVPEIDVYRKCIADVGGVTDVLRMPKTALMAFSRAFVDGHLGRKVDIIGDDKNTVDVRVTYGSSDYNTSQMSALIDSIVQECRMLDIPTMDDERICKLIEDWEKTHGA